jgi:hypothetical protein
MSDDARIEAAIAAFAGELRGGPPSLLLLNTGFFVFPITDEDRCSTIMAPSTLMAPHTPLLAVLEDCVDSVDGDLSFSRRDGVREFHIEGMMVKLADQSVPADVLPGAYQTGATVLGFGVIPDFYEMCCGLELDQGWQNSPDLSFALSLYGGVLAAVPTEKTCSQVWEWTKCDGTPHQQRVTTTTLCFSRPLPSPTLTFHTLDGAQMGAVNLKAIQFGESQHFVAGLINMPDKKADPRKVELGHHAAMLQICRPTGDPFAVPRKSLAPSLDDCVDPDGPRPSAFGPLLKLIVQDYLPLWDGTPECSNRWVRYRP